MDPSDEQNTRAHRRNPLVPIGFIVMGVLTIPIWLNSTSPEGPVKEGDVVFSTGRHHAYFMEPARFQRLGYQKFCILERRDQLVVLQRPAYRSDGTLAARIIGGKKPEVPYCPPQAEVFLKRHQASLKVDVWGGFQDTLAHLFATNKKGVGKIPLPQYVTPPEGCWYGYLFVRFDNQFFRRTKRLFPQFSRELFTEFDQLGVDEKGTVRL